MDFPTLGQLIEERCNPPPISTFHPTAPLVESGSPKKKRLAPIDPNRPQIGTVFDSLEAAVHFVKVYENRRGYQWRKGESLKKKGKALFRLLQGSN